MQVRVFLDLVFGLLDVFHQALQLQSKRVLLLGQCQHKLLLLFNLIGVVLFELLLLLNKPLHQSVQLVDPVLALHLPVLAHVCLLPLEQLDTALKELLKLSLFLLNPQSKLGLGAPLLIQPLVQLAITSQARYDSPD
jgi:hypothetical protein